MPLTREDIQKYGTKKEIKILETIIDEEIVESWSDGDITIQLYKTVYSGGKFDTEYDLHIKGIFDCANKEVGMELFSKLKELLQ